MIRDREHYNYFRDYDASLGRYTQSDPIGLKGGINGYAYVTSNGLRFSDRKGLAPDCPAGPDDDNCCRHPVSQQSLKGLGGTVMCCFGRKVSCAAPVDGPEPNRSIIRNCIFAHEDRHHQDVECRYKNTIEPATFLDQISTNAGECSAYRAHLDCLGKGLSSCGSNANCQDHVKDNMAKLLDKANGSYKCAFSK